MGVSVMVLEDGLTLRNVGGDVSRSDEKKAGTELRVDCDDFRQFLSDAKAGKFDSLV